MINLQRYVMIYEGGAGGHMAHPIDYTDFTGEQLIELVDNLFSGKIETMKEKLDGMNIKVKLYSFVIIQNVIYLKVVCLLKIWKLNGKARIIN